MAMRLLASFLLSIAVTACGGGGGGGGGGDDDDGGSGDGAEPDAGPQLPAWERGLPPSSVMEERRGLSPLRGVVHLHSPYSHDACDGEPRAPDGTVDQDCLQHLRDALCETRMDFAALTDHDDSMADEEWGGALFLEAEGDELVLGVDGSPIANRMSCEGGHRVLLSVGSENELMPIMLDRHPDGDLQARHDAYSASDAAAVATFRSIGGLAWTAHSESRDLATLTALELDGMEIFNLHAAIDPDIRGEWLGLDPAEAIAQAVEFASLDTDGPEPDLAMLAFMDPHQVSIGKWEELLRAGQRVVATAGTDAHENALPIEFRDGERGDSYRRTLRWFSNVVLVEDPDEAGQVEQALSLGRAFVVFEILGTPVGFDVRAELAGGDVIELGGEAAAGDGVTIAASTPSVHGLDSALPPPAVRTVIVRVGGPGSESEEIASGDGLVSASAEPGVYRVEVRMTPHHLAPYLGSLGPDLAERELVWIYSNPIHVMP
jgi:hypothetical protein